MSDKLYLFNPGSDLALANGDENYVLPLSIRKMTADLSSLPLWYAEPGSSVLLYGDSSTMEQIETDTHFHFAKVGVVTSEELSDKGFAEVCPWGWNPGLTKQLRLAGVSELLLPDVEQQVRIRNLSHRSFSTALLQELKLSGSYCGSAMELSSEEEVRFFVENTSDCILKAPWSGSGKGLFFCHRGFTDLARRWSRKVIESQRSVIGEVLYRKVKDFAMEFYSDGAGLVTFAGYSLFYTEERGAYKGNLLASDRQIELLLSEFVPLADLIVLKEDLIARLSGLIASGYRGYLGVDMMICSFSGMEPAYRIHPCVEINLRMNMGIVARRIYDEFIYPGQTGRFTIDYFSRSEDLMKDHEFKKAVHPLQIKEGKISSGYLALTPICEHTQYRASITLLQDI